MRRQLDAAKRKVLGMRRSCEELREKLSVAEGELRAARDEASTTRAELRAAQEEQQELQQRHEHLAGDNRYDIRGSQCACSCQGEVHHVVVSGLCSEQLVVCVCV